MELAVPGRCYTERLSGSGFNREDTFALPKSGEPSNPQFECENVCRAAGTLYAAIRFRVVSISTKKTTKSGVVQCTSKSLG